jgi:hypothetical protein
MRFYRGIAAQAGRPAVLREMRSYLQFRSHGAVPKRTTKLLKKLLYGEARRKKSEVRQRLHFWGGEVFFGEQKIILVGR